MKYNSPLYLVLTPLLIGLFSAAAYFIGTNNPSSVSPENIIDESTKINQILDIIEYKYVDSIDREILIENSILGMLEKLDPHSSYISAKNVNRANEELQGHFGGVGIRFIILRDTLMVTNVITGGPSQIAGLKSGDRIISVDQENIASKGLTNEGVQSRLKGAIGSAVTLIIYNPDSRTQKEIQLIRGTIPLYSIDAYFLISSEIGYIKLSSFSDKTKAEFKRAILKLKNEGMKSLILDLRNNGGGYLHGAISVADEFLKNNALIVYTEGIHQPRKNHMATHYGNFENGDLVVLVNSGSASASEIVSGAIQDNDRGVILGRRTFGKGLVQQPLTLSDESEIRLTVSRYYTPTGRCIQKPYGDGIDYNNELYNRFENGEMQQLDSSVFKNAKKFITPNGKVVYGGGGIIPDQFVAIDTLGGSNYYTELFYSSSFRDFCFDYYDANKSKMAFNSIKDYNQNFTVSEIITNQFTKYSYKVLNIKFNKSDFNISKNRIKNQLKSELATYIFDQKARYNISLAIDKDIQKAIEILK